MMSKMMSLIVYLMATFYWGPGNAQWTTNSLLRISAIIARGEKLQDCWICHQSPGTQKEGGLQLQPTSNYTDVPNVTVQENWNPITYTAFLASGSNISYSFNITDYYNYTISDNHSCTKWLPYGIPKDQHRKLKWMGIDVKTLTVTSSKDEGCEPDYKRICCYACNPDDITMDPGWPCTPTSKESICRLAVPCTSSWSLVPNHHPAMAQASKWCPADDDAHPACLLYSHPYPVGMLPFSGGNRTTNVWLNHANQSLATLTPPQVLCAPKGFIWICGSNPLPMSSNSTPITSDQVRATFCLAPWLHQGECTLGYFGFSSSAIQIYRTKHFGHGRSKRALGLILAGIGAAIGFLAPWGGFAYHEATLRNLTQVVRNIAMSTGKAIESQQRSLDSLANVVLDNRIALDFLLAEQGGVCAIANTSCCVYINSSGIVEMNVKKIYQAADWLHEFNQQKGSQDIWNYIKAALPTFSWFLPLIGPIATIFLLLVFGTCLFNLIVKSVSSRIQSSTS
uniref:Envelope protein syncytin-Ten1 n=1 Tax=Setifer setosus TaxID=319819 RepID=A0A089NGX2_SETSE|nr:envelope protein syncytin-Ten1 [Setifer setosus]AIQ85129.1 envelope protein syncytin-Ten1 [Setifer setosus]AIQ85130.1 envelope protein syncytin-Ten1 [synthetic construct]